MNTPGAPAWDHGNMEAHEGEVPTQISANIYINEETCRVCLEAHKTTLSLHDEIEFNDLSIELWQMLENVCNLKGKWNEPNLPTQLCQSCTRRLINAYEFVLDVNRSNQMLRDLYIGQEQSEPAKDVAEISEFTEFGQADEELLQIEECESVIELQEVELAPEEQLYKQESYEEVTYDEETYQALTTEDPIYERTTLAEPASEELSSSEIDRNELVSEVLQDDSDPGNTCSSDRVEEAPSQLGMRLAHSQNFIYKCASCPRIFAKSTSLARHFSTAHSQPADVAAQELAKEHNSKDELICQHCPRIFKRQDTLRRHMLAFHPEVVANGGSEGEGVNSPPKRTAKRRECPYCGISFPVSSLTIHIRRHTGDNPYKCDQCEKAFPRSQDLSLHKRQHTGERPSECKICAKKFISQNKLARHMRLHTGHRPYACDKCDKSFVQSNDLKIHMRRHTGERPYSCNVCGKSFVCGSLLNIHRNQQRHHDTVRPGKDAGDLDPYENSRVSKRRAEDIERIRLQREKESQLSVLKPYSCGVCGESFKSGALLTIHRNKMAHYEIGKVDYGDPYEQRQKQQQKQ